MFFSRNYGDDDHFSVDATVVVAVAATYVYDDIDVNDDDACCMKMVVIMMMHEGVDIVVASGYL